MDSDNSIPDAIQIGDETQPRTLYVGNLDTQMTEEFLVVLFSQIGPVKGCKIIHEVLLVAGGVIWDVAYGHRPVPPRHPLRLQRMAPRAPLHPRPLRHHHAPQQQHHASQQHPNVIHVPQHSPKPHRSFKPRIHIPLLSGLHHRPLLARLHNLHHHHHHPSHHHHHHGQHHHPHDHKHAHAHHHHHHHQHGRPGQQNVAAAQLPRLPPNVYTTPGVKPQQHHHHHHHQQHHQQQHQQQHFGFPAVDVNPTHPAPSAAPFGPPGRQPVRHFAPQHPPHFNFNQDPEIPFGNEPVSELPSNGGHLHSPFPTQSAIPQTTAAYGETSQNPHGFLGSTYKGWKPIAKPFQSSYPRGQEQQHQQPAGLPDFPRGPHDFPRTVGFPRGPQDFPPLSDNHLPAFPIHDFPSGPTGPPPNQQDFPRGHQENGLDVFSEPPQIPNFTRVPSTTGNPTVGENIPFDFPQYNGAFNGHLPQGFHNQHSGHHRHRHHPGHQAGKRPPTLYHPHPSPSPHNHQDFSFAPGHTSTTPRSEFPHFLPAGVPNVDHFNNLNTNTLFRENTMAFRPQQYPNQGANVNGQDVVVPLPPEIGDSVRLPNSIFNDNSWAQNNRDQPFETSQSEENVVIKKPKYGGKHNKLNHANLNQGGGGGGSDESVENQGPPSVLPKFRPRRPNKQNDNDKHLGVGNLHHHDGGDSDSPKLSNGSDEVFGGSGSKKINNGRGRVRIRTRLRRPNPFSDSVEENVSSGGGGGNQPTSPRPFPPFPGAKGESHSSRLRNPFRKQPTSPPPDNNISTENPNSSLGDDVVGPLSHSLPKPPGIKGPISEELSNFPSLPFPPPDSDFIQHFPSPVPTIPESSLPPTTSPPKLREHHRLPPPFGRPQLHYRGTPVDSTEQSLIHPSSPPPSLPPPSLPPSPPHRENSHPGPRPHLRRRRPKTPSKVHEEHQDHQHLPDPQPIHDTKDLSDPIHNNNANQLHNAAGLNLNQNLFSDEFFFPPGFNADPSKHNPGDNPVSFITMPNAKPHVIHHNVRLEPQLQHHLPTSSEQHHQQPHSLPQQNVFRGPTTQHFPLLEDFVQPNLGINNAHHQQFNNPHTIQHQHHLAAPVLQLQPQQQHLHQHQHNRGIVGGSLQNVQLPAFSDHLSFRPPSRGRKPPRNKHAPQKAAAPPPPSPTVLNPYAFPAPNPYAGREQYVPPVGQELIDNAPQNSAQNSYEIPESHGVVSNGNRPLSPVYHHPPAIAAAPQPQTLKQHHQRHHHHGAAPGVPLPPPPPKRVPQQLPPPRSPPQLPGPPTRGRFPGGRVPHRKPIVPSIQPDPVVMSQSAEFEQIPAQFVDINSLTPKASQAPPVEAPVVSQARPEFSKPHVHHSPDIHPHGSFFDDFFKPFDDAFGQSPGGVAVTQRSDGDMMHDEQQSQSNVQLNVVPSPKNANITQEVGSNGKKHWSKLKLSPKEEKAADSSLEKPGRFNKKPINGRFNSPNSKNHLKAKIADIARKNFQSHMAAANEEDPEAGSVAPELVTTYKPALIDSTTAVSNVSDVTPNSISRESTTTLKVIPTWKDAEDDLADSNVPKSFRYGSKADPAGPLLIHHRNKNNNNDQEHQDGTTILFKSKRQFRRKRPQDKEDQENRSGGRPSSLRQKKEEAPTSHSIETEDNSPNGSETTRVGVLRRRKLFPRRRNFSLSTKSSGKDVESATTADGTETESVTYGEGQWFRVKNADSNEEFGRVLDKNSLSSPVPTQASKTAGDFHISGDRKSLLHHSESASTSSVSTSMSSSSSSSTSSVSNNNDRILGKKSSKFLMNRLSIA